MHINYSVYINKSKLVTLQLQLTPVLEYSIEYVHPVANRHGRLFLIFVQPVQRASDSACS